MSLMIDLKKKRVKNVTKQDKAAKMLPRHRV